MYFVGCAMSDPVKPKISAAASCDVPVARLHHFKGQAEGSNVRLLPQAKKRMPTLEKLSCQEKRACLLA